MSAPRSSFEVLKSGFDEVRIVEKDVVEANLESSFLKFGTGNDGLLTATLLAMLVVTFVLAKVYPELSEYLSILQGPFSPGK